MTEEFDQAISELKYMLRRYRRVVVAVVLVLCGSLVVNSTFYTVKADEEGVVLRFGKHVRSTQPGLHGKLPWPLEEAIRVPTERVQRLEFGFGAIEPGRRTVYRDTTASDLDVARMLTGDLNLAHVEWSVQYRIKDAAKFLFKIGQMRRQPQSQAVADVIRDVSETVMRQLVGDVSVDEVLTKGRDEIASKAQHEIQRYLNDYDCGIQIVTVNLQTVSPPEPVKDAFDAVNRAKQNKERAVNEALGDRNRLIPEARGKRDRAIAEAEGYKDRVVKTATGRANAFMSKLTEYEKAPDITRIRMYLEAMEHVLSNVGDVVIIDDSVRSVLPLLDLDKAPARSAALRGGAK